MTTVHTISAWFDRGVAEGAAFMLVKWDSFDGPDGDYPVYIAPGENPREVAAKDGDRTMECYCLTMDKASQLAEHRAFHWTEETP